jgi:type II secretory pathway predicted ATPase ExeA
MSNYMNFFGFRKEPFPHNINLKDVYVFPGLKEMKRRTAYTVESSMVHVITGEVGSGKTTSLKYVCSQFHPSKHRIIAVIANTGGTIEFYRQLASAFGITISTNSLSRLMRLIREVVQDLYNKKKKPILVIDEAHLLREKVLRELHTILQTDFESGYMMPLILCGQSNLIDKLRYYTASALASRVVGRTHLQGMDLTHTTEYLTHHLKVAGMKESLYLDEAVMSIHQGSGGIFRKANNLARGALVAAAGNNSRAVSGEHVRKASTEIF